jgi:DinB superfamily
VTHLEGSKVTGDPSDVHAQSTRSEGRLMTLDLEGAKALLRRTPAVLDALLLGLPDPWVRENEGRDTWSSFDVVGHLVEAEETNWIPRVRHLIAHGESAAFPPFDRFGFTGKSKGKSMADILDTFRAVRARSLRELDEMRLTPQDLGRKGKHPDFGPVTLGQLLATWAIHDLNHLGQIVHVLARQHTEAVGPWRAFLGILDR